MKTSRIYAKIDYSLMFAVIALVIFGVIMVFSASYYKMLSANQSPFSMFKSSVSFAIIGTVVMIVVSFINYKMFKSLSWLMYIVALVLSIVVLYVGKEIKGGTRWLTLPILNIRFMPSEITKVAIIFTFSWLISATKDNIKNIKQFSILTLLLGVLAGITALQKDLSTTTLIVSVGLTMLFLGGCKWRHIFSLLPMGGLAAWIYMSKNKYTLNRIQIWFSTIFDRQYEYAHDKLQIIYSIYAVGSGGLFGKGLGMGELKYLRLPEPYNDFIFAIICEETGLFGAMIVLLLFIFIIYRIFSIAIEAKDNFGFLVASGTGCLIAYQVIINIGVVTNILPTTGITLPFVSKGGTSLIILLFLIGVVLNISLCNRLDEEEL